MIHSVVDMDRWHKMFPLAQLQEQERKKALERGWNNIPDMGMEMVTSPYHIAVSEQVRTELFRNIQVEKSDIIPADVFIFAHGEPERRDVTKIGGLPYRRADKPWPMGDYSPMTYVGQFCFADSKDITGELPGDVLLIFGANLDDCFDETFHFEWVNLGLDEKELVTAEGIPSTEFRIDPCYGHIHRTCDYPDPHKRYGFDEQYEGYGSLIATKIGGIVSWIQNEEPATGRYLCTLHSIQPSYEQPYPWMNVPEPIATFGELHGNDYLMWGDAGSLYLFMDDSGNVYATTQCY